MSLITIRAPREESKYNIITVTTSAAKTNQTIISLTNNSAFRRLDIGMTIFEDDSPAGTTSNKIIDIDSTNNTITLQDAITVTIGQSIEFTTASVKNSPLSNKEVDENFLSLEKNKIDSKGNQIIEGNVEIRETIDTFNPTFDTTTGNLYVSEKIIAKTIDIGGTGGTATLTTAGDIDVNNIILRGDIDDRALFEKYYVTAFPQHLLCRFNSPAGGTPANDFVAYTVLFLDRVDNLSIENNISFQTPGDPSTAKQAKIKEISVKHSLIYVEELAADITKKYAAGMTAEAGTPNTKYTIKRALRGEDFVKENQVIKIFGVGESAVELPPTSNLDTDSDFGFGAGTKDTNHEYKSLTLNRKTGKISAHDNSAAVIKIQNTAVSLFDETQYNRVTVNKPTIPATDTVNTQNDLSVLIYRKSTNESNFVLVGIVDNSHFGNSGTQAIFNDYGSFTINDHANKTDGRYVDANLAPTTDLEYLPLTYEQRDTDNDIYELGYQYVRVDTVDSDNTFSIKPLSGTKTFVGQTESSPAPASPINLKFFHNNAVAYQNATGLDSKLVGGLQKAIDDLSKAGINTLTLPAGVYHTGLITLPDNFTLKGESRYGTILRLPPLDDYSDIKTIRGVTGANRDNDLVIEATRSFSNSIIGITRDAPADLSVAPDNNISIENLTIDGNYHNRFFSNLGATSDILGDNLIRAENIVRLLIKGVVMENAVGGGIYAPGSKKLAIEDCDILDSCTELKDTEFYSPLYAIASQDINIINNRIRNANSAVELSNVVRGNLVGNTVQNSGTGVITYSSVNLISSPNLVIGPNNELITTTDVLDSEFDSINVDLHGLVSSSPGAYASPLITFLKEGESAHLAEDEQKDSSGNDIAGTGVILSSSIHVLAKQDQFEYFIEGSDGGATKIPLTVDSSDISASTIRFPATDRAKGTIQFRIEEDEVNALGNNFSMVLGSDNLKTKHTALTAKPEKQSLVGLAYQIHATEYTNLTDSDDYIPFTRLEKVSGETAQVKITLSSSVDMNDFIKNRKCILTTGINLGFSGGAGTTGSDADKARYVNRVITTADNYKVLTVVSTDENTVTLKGDTLDGNLVFTDLTGHYVGFQNKFLIAKGRILV